MGNYAIVQLLMCVSVALHDALSKGETVTVVMNPAGGNPWIEWSNSGGVVWQLFFIIYTVTCIAIAVYKWRLFVLVKGWQASVPQVCLGLEVIANLST
jgi:hypothetical protein